MGGDAQVAERRPGSRLGHRACQATREMTRGPAKERADNGHMAGSHHRRQLHKQAEEYEELRDRYLRIFIRIEYQYPKS